jgi:hypothetical protein
MALNKLRSMNLADTFAGEKVPRLANLGNVVPEGYEYYEKLVRPGEDLSLPSAYLKWYDIYPPGEKITQEQVEESRAFLEAEAASGRLKLNDELGFVLLHRAGSALLLIVTTWRNTNEMWESAYAKEAGQPQSYRPQVFDSNHRATYCVWELAPVWHERHAWVRFLSSPRDEEAKLVYLNDRFSGQV